VFPLFARRDLIRLGLGLGAAGLCTPAFATSAAAPARSISVSNLHTGETLRAAYFEGGAYVPDAMNALCHVLRDHRTGETHPITPRLFDLVSSLTDTLAPGRMVEVICGYRSPATNAALHAQSARVATHSLHMEGMAMDIRLPGVELARLRDAALSLGRGGVGYYPDSANNFVHVDVGRVRRW
jgi:uncharacterized protein YcbK (DUF882 family)